MQADNEMHYTTRQEENTSFALSFLPGTLFVALLWLISLLSYLTDATLTWLGVFPRNFFGLIGIFTGPLIHGDLIHLLSNTFPFVLLSGFILFQQRKKGADVIILVYLLSGLLTWFIGRQAYHIGASGVIYGMASYLLFKGFIGRDRGALAVSLAILFLYSGLFYGLFPGEERVSWEGHLGGLIAGFVAALTYGSNPVTEKEQVQSESPANLPEQQRHINHTLDHAGLYTYKFQYTLQDKTGHSIYTYKISPNTSKLTKQPDNSSKVESRK